MSEHYPEPVAFDKNHFMELYRRVKAGITLCCDHLRMADATFTLENRERKTFLGVKNVMEFSAILHDHFANHFRSTLIQSAEHIVRHKVITDDSPEEDIHIFFNAFVFLFITNDVTANADLIQDIISLSDYYTSFWNGSQKDFFDMMELEELMGGVDLFGATDTDGGEMSEVEDYDDMSD